jgi:hypothetical protein
MSMRQAGLISESFYRYNKVMVLLTAQLDRAVIQSSNLLARMVFMLNRVENFQYSLEFALLIEYHSNNSQHFNHNLISTSCYLWLVKIHGCHRCLNSVELIFMTPQ